MPGYCLKIAFLLLILSCGCTCFEKERIHPEPATAGDRKVAVALDPPKPGTDLPVKGIGILTGQLSAKSRSLMKGHLVLAKAVPTGRPALYLLELDNHNLHVASINEEGVFKFEKVIPGKYGLCVWDPLSASPLNDPKTGNTLFFDVLPNQTLNLGLLEIPHP
jgi:hypothetical protein